MEELDEAGMFVCHNYIFKQSMGSTLSVQLALKFANPARGFVGLYIDVWSRRTVQVDVAPNLLCYRLDRPTKRQFYTFEFVALHPPSHIMVILSMPPPRDKLPLLSSWKMPTLHACPTKNIRSLFLKRFRLISRRDWNIKA